MASDRVHRVTITLEGVGTRRVVDVPDTDTVDDVHRVVQAAMGWSGARPHGWLVDDRELEPVEQRQWLVGALVGRRAAYRYGRGWVHRIQVAPGRRPSALPYPLLLSAEHACPPEEYDGPDAVPPDLDLSRTGLKEAAQRVADLRLRP